MSVDDPSGGPPLYSFNLVYVLGGVGVPDRAFILKRRVDQGEVGFLLDGLEAHSECRSQEA